MICSEVTQLSQRTQIPEGSEHKQVTQAHLHKCWTPPKPTTIKDLQEAVGECKELPALYKRPWLLQLLPRAVQVLGKEQSHSQS